MVFGAHRTLSVGVFFSVNLGSPNTEPRQVFGCLDSHPSRVFSEYPPEPRKKTPGCLGYVGDSTIPKYTGMINRDYNKPLYIRISLKQPVTIGPQEPMEK